MPEFEQEKTSTESSNDLLQLIELQLIKSDDLKGDVKLPIHERRYFVKEMSQFITNYRDSSDKNTKEGLLRRMQQRIKQMDASYPARDLAQSPAYQKIHEQFFIAIQAELKSLGVPPQSYKSPLAEIIATMAPEKANELFAILVRGSETEVSALGNLYEESDTSEEAKLFRNFVTDHRIEYLGGGNGHNFKVVKLKDVSATVLKLDPFQGSQTKKTVSRLRDEVKPDYLAPAEEDRQVFCRHPTLGKRIASTLTVMPYYPIGSLKQQRITLEKEDSESLLANACDYFSQMASILLKIEGSRCLFPDAKIANWLVGENGELFIADTKSFVSIDENGNYFPSQIGITTALFTPPDDLNNTKANSYHAYLLGKNLYNYLTLAEQLLPENELRQFKDTHEGESYNFNFPVFKTDTGKVLGGLIEDLVKADGPSRMSVEDARYILGALHKKNHNENIEIEARIGVKKYLELDVIAKDLKKFLEPLQLESESKSINDYIKQKQKEMLGLPFTKQLALVTEVKSTVSEFKNQVIKRKEIISGLNSLRFGIKDKGMDDYLLKMNDEFSAADLDLDARTRILSKMEKMLEELHRDQAAVEVRTIIKTFRNNIGGWLGWFFAIGMGAKANRIEAAMAEVPVEQRAAFLAKQTPETKRVMSALASHRHLGKRGVTYLDDKDKIDENRAARTYTNFKLKFHDIVKVEDEDKKPQEGKTLG